MEGQWEALEGSSSSATTCSAAASIGTLIASSTGEGIELSPLREYLMEGRGRSVVSGRPVEGQRKVVEGQSSAEGQRKAVEGQSSAEGQRKVVEGSSPSMEYCPGSSKLRSIRKLG